MKKKLLILIPTMALAAFMFSCDTKEKQNEHQHDQMSQDHSHTMSEKYTCPMHPEVLSDKAGSCPKCGMDLVLQEQSHMDSTHHEHNEHMKTE